MEYAIFPDLLIDLHLLSRIPDHGRVRAILVVRSVANLLNWYIDARPSGLSGPPSSPKSPSTIPLSISPEILFLFLPSRAVSAAPSTIPLSISLAILFIFLPSRALAGALPKIESNTPSTSSSNLSLAIFFRISSLLFF